MKVFKKYRIVDKIVIRKLKEYCLFKNLLDDLFLGFLLMLEGEIGLFLLKE